MVKPKHIGELDNGLRECRGKVTRSSSAAAHKTITAVESIVAGVVARLPFGAGNRLLVALSGGPDSVTTLHALQRIGGRAGFQLAAAHLNHGIRGPESDRDERFVRELCGRLGIELVVERAHGLKPVNLEERARELRYKFLNRTADVLKAQFIVLGHHQDDQAETVLLRLLRGAGVAGMAAMAELGPGRLMRPLLSLDRVAILAYLAAIGADYVVDSSNFELKALRNRVRAELLPQLARDYSPGIARRLAELASEMREANSFIEAEACRSLEPRLIPAIGMSHNTSWRMDVRGFKSINRALARATLREFIRRCIGDLRRIERVHIDAMYHVATGENPSATVVLPRGWRFRRQYDTVMLEYYPMPIRSSAALAAGGDEISEIRLMPGTNLLSASGFALTLRAIAAQEPCFPAAPWHPPNKFEAYFDASEAPVLTVRRVRAGNRIQPLGLCGSRKIHDVFVDYKIAATSRSSWPLVVSDNKVVWIPGLVRSRIALVTSMSKEVMHLRADPLPDDLKL
ncbi:MAG: tRNA lysidine(34) synthetase TilS [Deltaproteobacteria bacterium]|nr:tRNA lysidine(34) synthetase TilS [Deltaproteobacteria bacterium]